MILWTNPWSEVPNLTLVSCNWRAEFESGKSMKLYNTPHGILRIQFLPHIHKCGGYTKPKGFFQKKEKHVWWGTILISWIQETMLVWSNITYRTFFEHLTSFDQNELSWTPLSFRKAQPSGLVCCYTLRASEAATTAKVSSRAGASPAASMLGFEAQVTERKPKITRSAATSVHHVLRLCHKGGHPSPKFSTDGQKETFCDSISGRVLFWGQKMCIFFGKWVRMWIESIAVL